MGTSKEIGGLGGRRARRATAVLGIALLAFAGVLAAAADSRSPAARAPATTAPSARAARTVNVKDEGHLHSVRNSGSELLEEGPVSGTIPGKVRVNFNIGATITATFTIYATGGGSISGRGSGALHSTGTYSTFGGSLTVTNGTGRYAHAHGKGGLYGAINRKTYALTVQTIGKLSY
jgi:hypothetical protein